MAAMRLNVTERLKHLLPVVLLRSTSKATNIFWREQGYLRSVVQQRCVDATGAPIPWYTYPAIEFLKQLDFTSKAVFEYGSGHSTFFWGARAARVVSIEHSPEWFETVSHRASSNCTVTLETDPVAYIHAIERTDDTYDLIAVDGLVPNRARAKCAMLALRHLAPGGLIVLDNSDYLPGSTALLRMAGLIQVDMSGLGPSNDYAWTTSLFLTRDYALQPLGGRQPHHPIGGLGQNWEPALERRLAEPGALPPLPRGDWRTASADELLKLVTD
jgi:hypothetical protein